MESMYKVSAPPKLRPDADITELFHLMQSPEVQEVIAKAQKLYLPWEEFRLKSWVPEPRDQIWWFVKFHRDSSNIKSPVLDKDGKFYTFDPRTYVQFLHEIDLELGENFMGVADFNEGDRRQIIRRNLIEESIASSKLEGANTSRQVARKMLREGREARNKDERMIANNHEAMKRIEEDLKYERLSVDLLRELHTVVTKGTLKNPEHEGELRETYDENGERLKIMPWDETTVAYVTPDKEFVDEQLVCLIEFANDEGEAGFVHPLIKAIILHFWIGLLHPFEDGNGRLARVLFYWYVLRKGYWAFSYLSLSEFIIKSPKQYAMSFIWSEQDDYDLNYFIHYNMKKLKLARENFREYLKEKISENKQSMAIIGSGFNLNIRQIRLLQYLAKDEQRYTNLVTYHSHNSDIGKVTAASDLKKLVADGFLKKIKNGRNVFYYPTEKVKTLIR